MGIALSVGVFEIQQFNLITKLKFKMKKIHSVVNIFATDNEDGQEWKHNDWFYKVTVSDGTAEGKRISKLYKSRNWASRFGKQVAKKVLHWWPI